MTIQENMLFTQADGIVLRKLAADVRERACRPENAGKRELWRRHNALKGVRPVVFVHPDGAWAELLPPSALRCVGSWARHIEYILRQRLIRNDVIGDDVPIDMDLFVEASYIPISEGWGLAPERVYSGDERGAWRYQQVIHEPKDWKKLKKPVLDIDEGITGPRYKQTKDLLGDLLDVKLSGVKSFSFHMMHLYCDFRGLENMMTDLVLEPQMVHDVMSFITEGFQGLIDQCVRYGLVSPNNDGTFHYTGGIGYTNELPKAGNDGSTTRLRDVWGAAKRRNLPRFHHRCMRNSCCNMNAS